MQEARHDPNDQQLGIKGTVVHQKTQNTEHVIVINRFEKNLMTLNGAI